MNVAFTWAGRIMQKDSVYTHRPDKDRAAMWRTAYFQPTMQFL